MARGRVGGGSGCWWLAQKKKLKHTGIATLPGGWRREEERKKRGGGALCAWLKLKLNPPAYTNLVRVWVKVDDGRVCFVV